MNVMTNAAAWGRARVLACSLGVVVALASDCAFAAEKAPQRPTAEQLLEATNPGHKTPKGWRQECIGRLVFDVPRNMEWGISKPNEPRDYVFTYEVRDGGEHASYGDGLRVFITSPGTREKLEYQKERIPLMRKNAVNSGRKKIEMYQGMIQDVAASKDNPEEGKDENSRKRAIDQLTRDIKEYEESIAYVETTYRFIDIGLPDAVAYTEGGTYRAFILRGGKMFHFQDHYGEGSPSSEERMRLFVERVKKFRYRKMYEIPRDRGVCIPFGFLPDDGTTPFDVRLSLRYPDRPNVIYTIGTGIVGSKRQPMSEASALLAATRANLGRASDPESQEVARRLIKRIEAHDAKIGALPAQQGGIAINTGEPGEPVRPNYSVYTGYGGWIDSQVLPFIVVDMRSFTRAQEPLFKIDPPPFEESYSRLGNLLKSIRLRPTAPVMPELSQ